MAAQINQEKLHEENKYSIFDQRHERTNIHNKMFIAQNIQVSRFIAQVQTHNKM